MGEFGIGQAVPRFEDPRLVRGEGRYVGDVSFPGMEGYVGKTVAHVILDYGPPSTAFDVATSQRCFNFTVGGHPGN